MPPALTIEGLGKQYRLGETSGYGTLRDTLAEGWRRRRGASVPPVFVWALRDVNLEVEEGSVVGIVGRNGAGKSTLLKILSRITEPTCGSVRLYGRVSSLLEVGTGFHSELTGRENVFLNGAILGMSREEIRRSFDDIVSFAEVEAFIDTPVKRYSSGMYLRLAFAVAAHLEPEILIVDEVLAVGDSQFQSKCLGKMRSVAASGRTVLFVSHNLPAVRALCSEGVLLDRGRVLATGPVGSVLEAYTSGHQDDNAVVWRREDTQPGAPSPRFVEVRLCSETPVVRVDEPATFVVTLLVEGGPTPCLPAVHFLAADDTILFSSACWETGELAPGSHSFAVTVPPFLFPDGRITVSAYVYNSDRPGTNELPCDWIPHTISFDVDSSAWVEASRSRWLRTWPGAVRPRLEWKTLPTDETCRSTSPN